jgi:hypothetical protein
VISVRSIRRNSDYHPLRQVQLMRWDGRLWMRFGEVFDGAQS